MSHFWKARQECYIPCFRSLKRPLRSVALSLRPVGRASSSAARQRSLRRSRRPKLLLPQTDSPPPFGGEESARSLLQSRADFHFKQGAFFPSDTLPDDRRVVCQAMQTPRSTFSFFPPLSLNNRLLLYLTVVRA